MYNVHINFFKLLLHEYAVSFTNIYSAEENEGIVIPSLLMMLNIHTVMITLLLSLLVGKSFMELVRYHFK